MRVTKGLFESAKRIPLRGRPQLEGLIQRLIRLDPDPQMALEELKNRILYRPEYFPEDRIEEVMEADPEKLAFLLIRDNPPEQMENLGEQFQDLSEMESPVEMMKVIPTMETFLQRLQ